MNEHSGKTRPTPSPERWAAIEAAFAEAVALGEAEQAEYLSALRRDDRALFDEVAALLGARGPWWIDDALISPAKVPEQAFDRIGPYQLVRPLGTGGMGEVWLAVREETDFRQHVALKIVRPGLGSADLRARFRAERQILASLNHPNITHLLDVGETSDGRPYLALEFVEGSLLTQYCDERRLTTNERLGLFRTICDAVRYAHQSLVIHHDLKPSNILVTKEGAPKLLDFGIAKVLGPEFGAGPRLRPSGQARLFTFIEEGDDTPRRTPADTALTPGYAAPEQLEGQPTTTAADIYSLGVILYELLSGHRPYHTSGFTRAELARFIRECQVTPASRAALDGTHEEAGEVAAARRASSEQLFRQLAGDLDAIVRRTMAANAGDRYSSVEQLVADIDRTLASRPISAQPHTLSYVADRFVRRHRWGVAGAAVASVVLTSFVAALLRQSVALRERSTQAERERERAVATSSFLRQLFRGADPGESRGANITARELLDRGAERVDRELVRQPAVQADLMDVMSSIYQDLGLYEPAEKLAAGAVTRARALGNDSVLAVALIEHGKALHWRGSVKDSEARYREALAILQKMRDTTGTLMVETLTYLGAALHDDGTGLSAEDLYQKAIALERARKLPGDTLLAFTLNNLGVALRQRGDLDGAEAAHREALAIRRGALGADHPESIRSLSNIAIVVGSKGNVAAAESLLTEVVDRSRRVLGPDHPSVADAINNLGNLYLRRKDPRRAIQFFSEALEIRKNRLGPKSSSVAQSEFNLGVAFEQAGDSLNALRSYRDALAIHVETVGSNDSWAKGVRDAIERLRGR